MTAPEALARAVQAAALAGGAPDAVEANSRIAEGRLWLDIARELREGGGPLAPGGATGERFKLDSWTDGKLHPVPAGALWPGASSRPSDATEQLDMSRLRPQVAEQLPPSPNDGKCRHCGMAIRFARRSADHPKPEWFHDLTLQVACVRPLGEAHQKPTFAELAPAA